MHAYKYIDYINIVRICTNFLRKIDISRIKVSIYFTKRSWHFCVTTSNNLNLFHIKKMINWIWLVPWSVCNSCGSHFSFLHWRKYLLNLLKWMSITLTRLKLWIFFPQGGRNSRSGMGAAESRSSRDALAKSRSQSSSALYHPPPPPSGAGNATTTTPIGNAVSASMWDIPHQHNQSPAKVRHHHHPKDNKRCCNLNKSSCSCIYLVLFSIYWVIPEHDFIFCP